MELDKTKVQDLFIAGSVNPALCMLFRKAAGMPGLLIYLYVRWRKSFPHYMTKQKQDWITLSNVAMAKYGFEMDPKTKLKAFRKLEKENLIQLHLLEKSGKAPQVRLLTK